MDPGWRTGVHGTDMKSVYRGRNDGGKIDLTRVYAPPNGFITAVGFVRATNSIVVQSYGEGSMAVVAVNAEGRTRTLLAGGDVPGSRVYPVPVL